MYSESTHTEGHTSGSFARGGLDARTHDQGLVLLDLEAGFGREVEAGENGDDEYLHLGQGKLCSDTAQSHAEEYRKKERERKREREGGR